MMKRFVFVLAILAAAPSAFAQQRPLVTEDPETIGAGRILFEGGVDWANDAHYPASGLQGNLLRIPTLGLSFGISSIAEFQLDGGLHDRLSISQRDPNAPLAYLLTATGASTSDFSDIVVGTKIRVLAETAGRPALGVRFATKLPTASNESGLGTDSMDFSMALLGAKTVQSIRGKVGSVGSDAVLHRRIRQARCDPEANRRSLR